MQCVHTLKRTIPIGLLMIMKFAISNDVECTQQKYTKRQTKIKMIIKVVKEKILTWKQKQLLGEYMHVFIFIQGSFWNLFFGTCWSTIYLSMTWISNLLKFLFFITSFWIFILPFKYIHSSITIKSTLTKGIVQTIRPCKPIPSFRNSIQEVIDKCIIESLFSTRNFREVTYPLSKKLPSPGMAKSS